MTEPRPYVPPDTLRAAPDPSSARKRPWMDLPDAHYHCWCCGRRDEDLTALARHEDRCTGDHPGS